MCEVKAESKYDSNKNLRIPSKRSNVFWHAGKTLLKEFGIPFKEDAQDVLHRYPWLADWDPGCPKKWRGFWWG